MKFQLVHGDCLDKMSAIPSGSVDLILTDPPYGTTRCKWDSIIPLDAMWAQIERVTHDRSAIVLMAAQPFTSVLINSNLRMFKYCWVWEKTKASGHLNAKKQPLRATEDVCVFYAKQCIYNPQGLETVHKAQKKHKHDFVDGLQVYGRQDVSTIQTLGNYPRNIIVFKKPSKLIHPTQKPVALMEYMIETYSNEGETVLDFTMGSGTTGEACINLNRNFIGIEIDGHHFQVAQKRLRAFLTEGDNG